MNGAERRDRGGGKSLTAQVNASNPARLFGIGLEAPVEGGQDGIRHGSKGRG
jgi:hypothetical protein